MAKPIRSPHPSAWRPRARGGAGNPDARTEAALRDGERRSPSIPENAVEGVSHASPGGRSLDANPALARLRGYERQPREQNLLQAPA